ncbi:hypothetical protein GNZ11_13915 [Paraburkholderia xenovorans]|nr:oxidoreductase-like domain-containing protein [Paraburkholderia xenovorans]NPT35601.1 hypothetical protein [Paraburkholderia xenovorans]
MRFAVSRATPEDDPQPAPPVQPDLDDCCHSGCNPCVFDRYDEALERYRTALAAWQVRQQAPQVHEAQEAQHVTAAQHSKPRPRR